MNKASRLPELHEEEQRAASIRHACPFCGALPGRPCTKTDGSGWELLLPHHARVPGAARPGWRHRQRARLAGLAHTIRFMREPRDGPFMNEHHDR